MEPSPTILVYTGVLIVASLVLLPVAILIWRHLRDRRLYVDTPSLRVIVAFWLFDNAPSRSVRYRAGDYLQQRGYDPDIKDDDA